MDKIDAVYFGYVFDFRDRNDFFVLSAQTETSSAGEQLVRDIVDDRQKCLLKGLLHKVIL
ncbi:MAG: hypothetical protein M9958_07295 [Chitinophagales bacterium]|nr:hypothetical protein [Chitinophagales bacterium]